jgi:hypothetical protein
VQLPVTLGVVAPVTVLFVWRRFSAQLEQHEPLSLSEADRFTIAMHSKRAHCGFIVM